MYAKNESIHYIIALYICLFANDGLPLQARKQRYSIKYLATTLQQLLLVSR